MNYRPLSRLSLYRPRWCVPKNVTKSGLFAWLYQPICCFILRFLHRTINNCLHFLPAKKSRYCIDMTKGATFYHTFAWCKPVVVNKDIKPGLPRVEYSPPCPQLRSTLFCILTDCVTPWPFLRPDTSWSFITLTQSITRSRLFFFGWKNNLHKVKTFTQLKHVSMATLLAPSQFVPWENKRRAKVVKNRRIPESILNKVYNTGTSLLRDMSTRDVCNGLSKQLRMSQCSWT